MTLTRGTVVRRAMLPMGPVAAFLVACVWLNQGVEQTAWERIRDRVFAEPGAHVLELLRYPFLSLYRRSGDEGLYYVTAAQILGKPYDPSVVPDRKRGRVPAWFESTPLPSDGRIHLPWVEVHLEYPPPLVPFIVAPALVTSSFQSYARVFGLLMGSCLMASIFLATDIVRRARAPRTITDGRWWYAAALMLALGALTIQRLDAFVGLAMIAAVHGAIRGSGRQFGFWGAVAGVCKIVPLLLIPVLVAADWSTWRPRIRTLAAWLAVGVLLGFAPMLSAGPLTTLEFFRYHGARGLQVESTLAVLLGVARYVVGDNVPATLSYGSFNLDGAVPDALARLTAPLTLAVIVGLALRERRSGGAPDEPQRIERITCAALAATVAVWLCSKVFSPQYLVWGIPLAVAIPARRGAVACALLLLAYGLTQLFYPNFYDTVVEQRPPGLLLVLLRQSVLIALLLYLLARIKPREKQPLVGNRVAAGRESGQLVVHRGTPQERAIYHPSRA